MCVAIVLPSGVTLPADEVLAACFRGNNDGAGFGYYRTKKQAVISKGYLTLDPFLSALKEARKSNPQKNFLIHFRNRTRGLISTENTHPFLLKHGMLIHNGTFTGLGSEKQSDTAHFAELIHDIPANKYDDLLAKVKPAMSWGAVVILDRFGEIHKLTTGAVDGGYERDGVWYSNRYWTSYLNSTSGTGYSYRGGRNSSPAYDHTLGGWHGRDN